MCMIPGITPLYKMENMFEEKTLNIFFEKKIVSSKMVSFKKIDGILNFLICIFYIFLFSKCQK